MEFLSGPVVRTPGFHRRTTRATGSILVQGTKILYVTQYSQKKKKNQLTPKSYNLNIYKLPILLWRIQFWLVIEQEKKKNIVIFILNSCFLGLDSSPSNHWVIDKLFNLFEFHFSHW